MTYRSRIDRPTLVIFTESHQCDVRRENAAAASGKIAWQPDAYAYITRAGGDKEGL